MDPIFAAVAERKMTAIIEKRGAELELLLKSKDLAKTRTIPVKAFSECLKAFSDCRGGGDGEAGSLTHADRKVLYRKWAVDGEVGDPEKKV